MRTHLHQPGWDVTACGRCGPEIRFSHKLPIVDCKTCLNAVVVNLNDPNDWRLKHLGPEYDEDDDDDDTGEPALRSPALVK